MNLQLKSIKKRMIFLLVLVLLSGSLISANSVIAVSSCTLDWKNEKQFIDGFGGSGAFHQAANLLGYPEKERNQILDLLFSQTNGIGLSIVRNIIGDDGNWGKPIDGASPSIEPQEGVWNWSGDEDQIWLINEAKKRGCIRFVSTVWSPPAWMKTNNSVINGGELRQDKYQAFADYLAAYVRGYKEYHNIEIYGVSPANEPDYTTAYSSCRWTGAQFRDFVKNNLKPTFERDGVKAKVIMPETMNFNEDYAVDTLKDPKACEGVDIVAAHAYDFAVKQFPVATGVNKSIWQTEVSNIGFNDGSINDGLKYAKLLHDHLTVTGVNAWIFWWLISYKDGESLIHLDTTYKTFSSFKRLYTIGNYSRFIRPGYVRIDSDLNPVANVFVTAYKDKISGKFAIVVINKGEADQTVNINLKGFPVVNAVVPYRTSDTENLVKLSKVPVAGKTFRAVLKAKSVTTFVGANNEQPARLSVREATSLIKAASCDDKSDIKTEASPDGDTAIVFTKKGAFAVYRDINFGNGTETCDLKIADVYGGGKLELLMDSWMGKPLAKYNIKDSEPKSVSGKTAWKTLTIPTERVKGVHDLYLVFTPWDTGTICKLNWLQFKDAVIPPTGKIKIQMANETAALKTDNIRPHFKIVNTGSIPVKLEEVKIRYFYTLDSETPQQFGYSGGSMPQSTVTGTFVKMNSLTPKSNYYLEIGFTAAAGVLDTGKDAELHVLLATKGTAYRQENDFSFNSKQDVMADWEGAAGYIGGKLCWGNEPSLLINPGFEDGSVAGWFNFGGPSKIMVTDETSQTGAYCLLITNRSESWQGLAQDLMAVMKPGLKYEVSAWIKLKNKAGDAGRVSIKKTDDKGDSYTWVDSKAVSDRDWIHISGFYELKVTGTLKALQLYTEGPEPGVEYYVDNVVVREVPVSNQEAK
jgi:glucuronoarabinoxylan endo-1,4-beta-xylanase